VCIAARLMLMFTVISSLTACLYCFHSGSVRIKCVWKILCSCRCAVSLNIANVILMSTKSHFLEKMTPKRACSMKTGQLRKKVQ